MEAARDKYGQYPDPTPEQIRAACEAIRATWSRSEERSRRAIPFCPARIPGVDFDARAHGVEVETEIDT